MNRRTFLHSWTRIVNWCRFIHASLIGIKHEYYPRVSFVFCDGAWDTSMVFAPEMLNNAMFTDKDDTVAIGGLSFVDGPNRPEVRFWVGGFL